MPKSAREFIAAARKAKRDSLGLAKDVDALMQVANVSRRAFLDKKNILALGDWAAIVQSIACLDDLEPPVWDWIRTQLVGLETALGLVETILEQDVATAVKQLENQNGFVKQAQRTEVRARFEQAFRTEPDHSTAGPII